MRAVPLTLKAANEFVTDTHRHHGASRGCKFAVGVIDNDGELRGVAIAGRPVARALDDGRTLEVLRVATDGCRNACSFLYGIVKRIARTMGYQLLVTYTLAEESGSSLLASGFTPVAEVTGRSWTTPSRPRTDKHPTTDKVRWEVRF